MKNRAAYWQKHIDEWKETSLTQYQYCQTQGISYHSFKHWRTKLNRPKQPHNSIQIVQLKTSIRLKESQPILLRYGSCEMTIPAQFDDDAVGRLLLQIKRILQ